MSAPSAHAGDDSEVTREQMRDVVADAAGAVSLRRPFPYFFPTRALARHTLTPTPTPRHIQLHPAFLEDAAAFEAACSTSALAAFTARLGHKFTRLWLLRAALTHASFRAEVTPSDAQSLLAWIGDATLQCVASEELVTRYGPAATGGSGKTQAALSPARALVLSRSGCARHARVMGLDAPGLMLLGGSFKGSGSSALSQSMLAEAYEAVIGAVALDAGRDAAKRAFLRADPFPVKRLKDLAGAYSLPPPSGGAGAGA